MKKLKVGIIGLGGICNAVHLPSYEVFDDVEVVAVCDINESKFNQPLIPKNAKQFTDYKELLKEDLDIVDLCVPNYLHSIMAVAALKAGKNVMCEKPDAISVAEMNKMITAEKESGKKLMVMRNNRHIGASKSIKKMIDEGKLGDIYAARCGWIRRRGIPGKGGWFTTKELSGGGPLIDLGVHMIDLTIYLMGNPKAVTVSGSTFCKFASTDTADSVHSDFGEKVENGTFDVEDLAMGFIRFDNGACLQLEVSWASNIENESKFMELRGSKAGIKFEDDTFKVFTEDNGVLFDSEPKGGLHNKGHENCLRHFINVVEGKEQADYTTSQGLNVIKILEAMYRSAKENREITL